MRKEAVIQVMLAEDEKERAAESVKAQAADSGRTVADMEQLDSGQTVTGILEVMADGFGFIRSESEDSSGTERRKYGSPCDG